MLIPNVSDIDKKILAYDVDGRKDILGLWIQKTESKHFGMQILDYPSAVRKIMYTTNAIQEVNSGFRKVTKRGAFSSDYSVFKFLYLRITEFYRKWTDRPLPIGLWSEISFQLMNAWMNFLLNSIVKNFSLTQNC